MPPLPPREAFLRQFNEEGYVLCTGPFSEAFIAQARAEVIAAVNREAEAHPKDAREFGLLLCSAAYGGAFFDYIANDDFCQPFEWVLGPWYTAYIYSSACIAPNQRLFTSDMHVDLPRFIPGPYPFGVGAILCLDDFTEENGATWILPRSHLTEGPPDEDTFWRQSVRFVAPKGSVCYFNPRLWHAAGENKSAEWRCSLNVGMGQPWMKPRIDIPRFLENFGTDISNVPEKVLRRLGYHAQPPASYAEYFAPREQRSFRQPFV